jgi:hypothetical protein
MFFLPMVLKMQPNIIMNDDQFFDFCQLNRDLRIERNHLGDLLIRDFQEINYPNK